MRKPRVFLLILYILLAVPVGLLGILRPIVPTLLFLVLSGLIITGGVMAVTSAFGSGIAVFAGYHGHNRHGVYPAGAGTAGAGG